MQHISSATHNLCLLSSSGLGLDTSGLRWLVSLDGLLALSDGRGPGDGVLAEVRTVVALGGRVDNGRVGLAGGLAGAEGGGLDGGRGLVVLVGLLDEKGDAALLAGDDTDGLVGDRALVLAAVDVPQVKRVARELDAICPLDERGAASLGNLPGKVVRDGGGHCVCMECGYGRRL